MKPILDERGSVALELALFTPVLIMLMLLVVFAGRLSSARTDVVSAAKDAARAASIRDDPATAARDARSAARAAIDEGSLACASLDVAVDTSRLRPGGVARVQLTCVASLADLSLLGVPGSKSISASATEPIDRFRSQP